MRTNIQAALAAGCITLMLTTTGMAVELLSAGDFVIAIDTDPGTEADSGYPGGEAPNNALDGNSGTKYLNFGKLNTGFIAQPFTPGTVVQSLQLTTANDAPPRDPLTYELYGTNDPITSGDNSFGDQEAWSLISSGLTGLLDLELDPDERFTPGTVQSFTNSTPYNAYRVVFPTIRDADNADSMQLADFDLFASNDGSGSSVFNFANDPVRAIGLNTKPSASSPGAQGPTLLIDDFGGSQSGYPGAESPANVVDGTAAAKYLNFGGSNSGFIVTPTFGSAQVQSFQLTTANDFEGRDPAAWQLFGTNDPITSGDNSFGTDENWTLVDFGAVALPETRLAAGPVVPVTNTNSYSSYKMLFPALKIPGDPLMQLGEASFFTDLAGAGADILTPGDTVLAIDPDMLLGTQTTHLNFGKENSGFIVTPTAGSTIVDQFQITTGGDEPPRDPASWELYGTNDPITSENFSQGDQENWVLIDSGAFDLMTEITEARLTTGDPVAVNNSTAYSSYRMIFTTLRDTGNANSVQLADVQFFGELAAIEGDYDNSGQVEQGDLDLVLLNWGRAFDDLVPPPPTWVNQVPAEGTVDQTELDLVLLNWGNGGTPPLAAVPEPSTMVCVIFSLIAGSARVTRRVAKDRMSRR